MANANIKAVITAEDRASSVLSGFGNKVDRVAKDSAIALMAIGTAAVAFGVSSVKSYMEQEDAVTRLQGAILNVKSAVDSNITPLTKQAAALQKVTRFSDEQIISAQGILATYQLNQKQIEQLTPSLIDMSEGMAQLNGGMPDLEGNAKLVAKALGGEDTDSLVGVLRRANIMLTNHQVEIFKTGTFQERMGLITEVLNMNVGGLGKKMGETTSGHLLQFKHAIDEVKESIGGTIANGLNPLMVRLTTFVESDKFQAWVKKLTDWLAINLPKALDWVINVGFPNLTNILKEAWPVVEKLWGMFSGLVKFLVDNQWVFWAIVGVLGAIKTALFLEGALTAFKAVMTGVTVAYGGVATLIASPLIMPAIVIVAALAAIWKIRDAAFEAWDAVERANNAADSYTENAVYAIKKYVPMTQAPYSAAQQKAARNVLHAYEVPGYAEGGPVTGGNPYIVGERGPELFMPSQSGTIVPNNKLGNTGSVNFNVNIGMYAGTEMEKRKVAVSLMRAYQDALAGGRI